MKSNNFITLIHVCGQKVSVREEGRAAAAESGLIKVVIFKCKKNLLKASLKKLFTSV